MGDYVNYIKYSIIAILVIAVIFYVKDKIELFLYQRYLHKFGSLQDYRVNHPKLIQANGDVICSAIKHPEPVNIKDRLYFQNALIGNEISKGQFLFGKISGNRSCRSAGRLSPNCAAMTPQIFFRSTRSGG